MANSPDLLSTTPAKSPAAAKVPDYTITATLGASEPMNGRIAACDLLELFAWAGIAETDGLSTLHLVSDRTNTAASARFANEPAFGEYTVPARSHALMQGEEVVALVFEERFAEMLSKAPIMLALIERASSAPCDFAADGTHADDCLACDSRALLEELPPAPSVQ